MKKRFGKLVLAIISVLLFGGAIFGLSSCEMAPTSGQLEDAQKNATANATIEEFLLNGIYFDVKKGNETVKDNDANVRTLVSNTSFVEVKNYDELDECDYVLFYESFSRMKVSIYKSLKIIVVSYEYKPGRGENQKITATGYRTYTCSNSDFDAIINAIEKL